jgi:hypothetical protein
MKVKTPDPKIGEIELVPDAWPRFERFIKEIAKAGPQHRAPAAKTKAKPHVQSFLNLLENLRLLLDHPGIPRGAADSVFQLIEHLNKCFRVKLVYETAIRTGKATIVLEPTDLFTVFVTAFRAGDWPQVSVIEHAICSSNAEKCGRFV